MSVEHDVREALARVVEPIVPEPDPMGRLLKRRRRRRVGVGAFAAVVCLAVAVGLAGRSLSRPNITVGGEYTIGSSWTRRLLDSPTRGSLAGDRALVNALARGAAAALRPPRQLDRTHVLFVGDIGGRRVLAVAFSDETSAMLFYGAAPAGASASALLDANGLVGYVRIAPFMIIQPEPGIVVGLAPAGCQVSAASAGGLQTDGSVRRTWSPEPTGDYFVRDGSRATGLVRVTCDGVVRFQGPVQPVDELSPGRPGDPVIGEEVLADARGSVDRDTGLRAAQALASLARRVDLQVAGERVIWGGRDGGEPIAVAVATTPRLIGLVLCVAVGSGLKSMVAVSPDGPSTGDQNRDGWSMVATGTASTEQAFAVRLPKRAGSRAVLSDRVLVGGLPNAVSADVGATRVPLTDGFGVITVATSFTGTITARSADGQVVADIRVVDGLFGEPVVSAW
jgi:hypothetical protein